jgi:hypothetical protein
MTYQVSFLDWLEKGAVTPITPCMVALDRDPQQVRSVGLNRWGCFHVAACNLKGSTAHGEILAVVQQRVAALLLIATARPCVAPDVPLLPATGCA